MDDEYFYSIGEILIGKVKKDKTGRFGWRLYLPDDKELESGERSPYSSQEIAEQELLKLVPDAVRKYIRRA